jgi:hypothetical protein
MGEILEMKIPTVNHFDFNLFIPTSYKNIFSRLSFDAWERESGNFQWIKTLILQGSDCKSN